MINLWSYKKNEDLTLRAFLFGGVKLPKNANYGKYKYSGYGIWFDARGSFLLSNDVSEFGNHEIKFGAAMSSSAHIEKRKKIFQFLVKFQRKS